jgi:hypothetical protein
VAAFPFATQLPQPGMAAFEDVKIQLIDTPPVTADYMEIWMPDTVRRGDGAMLVADLGSDDLLEGLAAVLERLSAVKIDLVREPPDDPDEVTRSYRRAGIIATKRDRPGADDRLEILKEFYGDRFDIHAVSSRTGEGLDDLRRALFDFLRVIRAYTKEPGKTADLKEPYTVPAGTDVLGLAARIHQDFADGLKSARVWGSGKYDGIKVKRDHVLRDGDIVELHM